MEQYEPELFPGLIYRMVKPKIVLLIFVSGKIVLTGAKVSCTFLMIKACCFSVLVSYHCCLLLLLLIFIIHVCQWCGCCPFAYSLYLGSWGNLPGIRHDLPCIGGIPQAVELHLPSMCRWFDVLCVLHSLSSFTCQSLSCLHYPYAFLGSFLSSFVCHVFVVLYYNILLLLLYSILPANYNIRTSLSAYYKLIFLAHFRCVSSRFLALSSLRTWFVLYFTLALLVCLSISIYIYLSIYIY
jgi:hypothetical protein